MPLPAIVGIPFLAGLLGSLFGTIIEFFAKYFTKKIAVSLAVIAALLALTVAFVALLEGFVALISYAAPAGALDFISLLLPSNFTACMSVILSARLSKWAYDWNVRFVQMQLI